VPLLSPEVSCKILSHFARKFVQSFDPSDFLSGGDRFEVRWGMRSILTEVSLDIPVSFQANSLRVP
jgi:hypothetical protein